MIKINREEGGGLIVHIYLFLLFSHLNLDFALGDTLFLKFIKSKLYFKSEMKCWQRFGKVSPAVAMAHPHMQATHQL